MASPETQGKNTFWDFMLAEKISRMYSGSAGKV